MGCEPLEMAGGGAVAASACVMGAESTTCAESCARMVREDGTNRQGPRVSRRGHTSERVALTRQTHQVEREKGKRARGSTLIGRTR